MRKKWEKCQTRSKYFECSSIFRLTSQANAVKYEEAEDRHKKINTKIEEGTNEAKEETKESKDDIKKNREAILEKSEQEVEIRCQTVVAVSFIASLSWAGSIPNLSSYRTYTWDTLRRWALKIKKW
jgi:ElaB/YqjD/DUF883 family membrane-anchored ribosome-binding protein